MGTLISIQEKEVKTISKRASLVGMDYDPKTVRECEELYRNAPQIAEVAKAAIKDGLQGKALLEAKKIICGEEKYQISDKLAKKEKFWHVWKTFLNSLNLYDNKLNKTSTTTVRLLDFAGYKERGGEIDTASHYREAKKVTGSTDEKVIDAAYKDAGGKDLETAKDVKEKMTKTSKKVFVKDIYEEEVGVFNDECLSTLQLQEDLSMALPETTRTEWKAFYRKMSHCIHPDKNSEDGMQAILNDLDKVMTILFKQENNVQNRREYNSDFRQWKEDRGYESDYILEDEL